MSAAAMTMSSHDMPFHAPTFVGFIPPKRFKSAYVAAIAVLAQMPPCARRRWRLNVAQVFAEYRRILPYNAIDIRILLGLDVISGRRHCS